MGLKYKFLGWSVRAKECGRNKKPPEGGSWMQGVESPRQVVACRYLAVIGRGVAAHGPIGGHREIHVR